MMMRLCSLLLSLIALLSLIKAPAMAAAETDETVLIYSATDIPAISPVLDAFRAANPDLVLEYREFNTLELHERMQSPDDGDSPIW
ncbi:hypothetical protein [Marinobacterium aestuariivivens]|uniref:ABC transporter substrate-binding protein n=1 Tax=Marinobacterium aestuariivivens TaxID=1698799 RepID=A0ABW2A5S1_9GAMM